MLTIGQLATYAGVTPRTVRHYHQVGLLPEPERTGSGYRTYDAQDVVRLIRVRTLADAGVPLARIQDLLEAGPEEFAAAVDEIDRDLRARVRDLQEHRRRIARLAEGDSLAVPPEVQDYLERLRGLGLSSALVTGERDGWILIAARWPERIPAFMADKHAQLDDPRTVELYRLLDAGAAGGAAAEVDDVHLAAVADLMAEMFEQAAHSGELDRGREEMGDDAFVGLVDALADGAHPMVERLRTMLAERGWVGWSRVERRPEAGDAV